MKAQIILAANKIIKGIPSFSFESPEDIDSLCLGLAEQNLLPFALDMTTQGVQGSPWNEAQYYSPKIAHNISWGEAPQFENAHEFADYIISTRKEMDELEALLPYFRKV